jgi:hypothetical protein
MTSPTPELSGLSILTSTPASGCPTEPAMGRFLGVLTASTGEVSVRP